MIHACGVVVFVGGGGGGPKGCQLLQAHMPTSLLY